MSEEAIALTRGEYRTFLVINFVFAILLSWVVQHLLTNDGVAPWLASSVGFIVVLATLSPALAVHARRSGRSVAWWRWPLVWLTAAAVAFALAALQGRLGPRGQTVMTALLTVDVVLVSVWMWRKRKEDRPSQS